MAKGKDEIITFKVNSSLREAMRGIENRSEFIRAAVLNALDSTCPLCKGTGTLTPNQKSHWSAFKTDHRVEECAKCHELTITCEHRPASGPHAGKAGKRRTKSK